MSVTRSEGLGGGGVYQCVLSWQALKTGLLEDEGTDGEM